MADDAGALLVRAGLIVEEQLLLARRSQTSRGGTLGEHLVLGGFVDDEELTRFFHNRLMVPRMDPNKLARIPASMIRRIPADMASEFRVVPVAVDREQNLTVVMSDPSNNHAVDEIAFFTGCYVMRAIATQRQIAWCLAHYYGYVSALGQTLLQPSTGQPAASPVLEASPADGVPKPASDKPVGSVTGQVEALRHKVVPPETPAARGDAKERSTGPMKAIKPPPPPPPANPPELEARAGEIDVPAVVEAVEPELSEPVVILDRPRVPDVPDAPDAPIDEVTSEVLVLDTPKKAPSTGRTKKKTAIGVGLVGRGRAASEPGIPKRPGETTGETTGETNVDTGQFRRVDYEYDEEEWDGFGPPGTTIPPGFLGAMPDANGTGPHNAIPIATDFEEDSGGEVTVPNPIDPVAALAHTMEDAADTQRELDQSAMRLVETLRDLDRARSRDGVVEALLEHLARSFNRCCFLVLKGENLIPFRCKGIGPFSPIWKSAELPVAEASMFRDVISSRMPFRGPAADARARDFVTAIFGGIPDEIVVVPLSVRERIVGVLVAGDRFERIFQEHVAVVARAAGEAFLRILELAKK